MIVIWFGFIFLIRESRLVSGFIIKHFLWIIVGVFILLICILASVLLLDNCLLFFDYQILFSCVDFIALPCLKDLEFFLESWKVAAYSTICLNSLPLPFVLSKTNDTLTKFKNMTDSEFKQWFVGFTDAEGCFRIAINNKNKVISFNFSILLHIDDKEVLEFIKKN